MNEEAAVVAQAAAALETEGWSMFRHNGVPVFSRIVSHGGSNWRLRVIVLERDVMVQLQSDTGAFVEIQNQKIEIQDRLFELLVRRKSSIVEDVKNAVLFASTRLGSMYSAVTKVV